jgi:hypothetical protein
MHGKVSALRMLLPVMRDTRPGMRSFFADGRPALGIWQTIK